MNAFDDVADGYSKHSFGPPAFGYGAQQRAPDDDAFEMVFVVNHGQGVGQIVHDGDQVLGRECRDSRW